MLKAAVFMVVLTLVGSRMATVLCGSWCDRGLMPVTCHHDAAAPAVAAMSPTDACLGTELLVGLWRDETRSGASGHDRDLPLPPAIRQLARPDGPLRSRYFAWSATALERRPFSTQLRI